jgi:3-oxoadipate enol-lactonase
MDARSGAAVTFRRGAKNTMQGKTAMPMMPMSDGTALHYRLDGDDDRPVMVLSNSLGSTLDMWDLQMPVLAGHFRVLRYDNRGHGASDVPAGPYSLARVGLDAQELIEALKLTKVTFCGLSLGGMVGLWLGAHAPGLVTRAVLANTSAFMGQPDMWNARIALIEAEGMQAVAGGTIQRWLTAEFIERQPAVTAKMLAMVAGVPPKGYTAMAAALRDMDLRADLPLVTMPTLVIAGARDIATPPAMAEAIAGAIPSARLAILDAAHLSNVELPDEFTKLVLTFLRQAEAATAAAH